MNIRNWVRYTALIVPVTALVSTASQASLPGSGKKIGVRFDLHGTSYHFDRCYRSCTEEYNENNLGFGIAYSATRNVDVMAGFFENSFDRRSTYLGINLGKSFGNIKPGLMIGGVTGYDGITKRPTYKGVAPAILPNVSINLSESLQTNLGFIPSGFAGKSNVVILRFGLSL